MSRFVAVLALVAALVAACLADDKYNLDSIDVDALLKDDKKLEDGVNCLLDAGDDKCNEKSKALKSILAEALQNDCAKCTDKQKEGAKLTIKFLKTNKPDTLTKLFDKFDPNGTFKKNHPDLFA